MAKKQVFLSHLSSKVQRGKRDMGAAIENERAGGVRCKLSVLSETTKKKPCRKSRQGLM
jgi:hypothetical protein